MNKPPAGTVRRKPNQRTLTVSVRMSLEDVRTLDRYIAAQPSPKPSRGAVIRRVVSKEIEDYRALEELGLASAQKLGS